jgi:hypothetical protein
MLSFGLAAVLRPLGDSVLGVLQRPVLDVLTFSTTNAQNTLNIGGNFPTRAILFPQKKIRQQKIGRQTKLWFTTLFILI